MNIYVQMIQDVCLGNKYTKWYCNIISKRLQQFSSKKEAKEVLGYCEGHHILPKCFKMGGETDKENIAYLTAREHFLVHMLLVKMIDCEIKYKLASALTKMNLKNEINSRTYETARILYSNFNAFKLESTKEKIKLTMLGRHGVEHPSKSNVIKEQYKQTCLEKYDVECFTQSDVFKEKREKTMIERYDGEFTLQSLELKEKARITMIERYGVENCQQNSHIRAKVVETNLERYGEICYPKTDESKEKARIRSLQNYNTEHITQSEHFKEKSKQTCLKKYGVDNISKLLIKCPRCYKEGGANVMKRWHFDKCKFKI